MRYILIFLLSFSTCFAQQVKVKVPPNKDTVVVTFNVSSNTTYSTSTIPAQGNKPPVANAGVDKTITLPTNTVTLFSTGSSDPEGGAITTAWASVSGPNNPTLFVSGSACNVSNLIQGVYVFRLTVTDDIGLTATDNVNVIVNPDATTPPPTTGYTLTYSNGFDKTSDLTTNNGQYGNGYVTTDAGTWLNGGGAFRSRPAKVSGGVRSEYQTSGAGANPPEGALEYDAKYDYIVQGQCHSLQAHPQTSGGSASPGLWHEGGKFVWYNWKAGGNSRYPTSYTIPKGVWLHFRIEYKFGSAGYIRHYIDSKLIFERTNIQVGDNSGFYWKIGFNGSFDGNDAEAQRSDITYENLKIFKKN